LRQSERRCIYSVVPGLCPGTSALNKEDYLPRALGNFRGLSKLTDKVCVDCNQRFSKLEDVLLHVGPEAIFREIVGDIGRKKHRNKAIFYEHTHGLEPLKIVGNDPDLGYRMLYGVSQGNVARPLSQLIMKHPLTRETRNIRIGLHPNAHQFISRVLG